MPRFSSSIGRFVSIAVGLTAVLVACSDKTTTTPVLPTAYDEAKLVADVSSLGAYKGLALAPNAGANFLYATNFKNRQVDVFDRTYALVSSFTDATIPAGYAPPTTLYFCAGPSGETHGLLGTLTAE